MQVSSVTCPCLIIGEDYVNSLREPINASGADSWNSPERNRDGKSAALFHHLSWNVDAFRCEVEQLQEGHGSPSLIFQYWETYH